MFSPILEPDGGEDSLDFDATLCAALYNRIIHIGVEGSQLAQQGKKATKNWFEPIADPEMMPWYFDMADWEVMHEFVVILPDNNTDKDCDGLVMHIGDLTVFYLPKSYDLNPGRPDEVPWFDFQEALLRLNLVIEAGEYKPVPRPPAGAEYNGLLDDTESWEINHPVERVHPELPILALANDSSLDQEVKGFPRAFLNAAERPRFKYFTPGLTIYDPASHPQPVPKALRPHTPTYTTQNPDIALVVTNHDALILFPANRDGNGEATDDTGLWICPDEGWADTVTLSLPYALPFYHDHTGRRFDRRSYGTQLWQHVDCPFYTQHRTRLVTLDGVQVGLDFYRQAEDQGKSEWFRLSEPCFSFEGSDY
ncbi:hypothetical protein BJY01DRAFT_241512 [Aspergillus pseudoustus]|uniref:Uncharacterized protein n=1 Tax=Aspergillus pseudoustus TaxID=1810923 RepID=A0ABR4ID66_9EURO